MKSYIYTRSGVAQKLHKKVQYFFKKFENSFEKKFSICY